jgi:flavin-dependent dehydrogenase
MNSDFYDFVIAGAGPAGLTAGIVAARKGRTAVVLEKGSIAGPRPRGEGIRPNSFLYNLLGKDYFDTKCFTTKNGDVFHSPGDVKQVRVVKERTLCFFEWRTFIDRLVEVAEEAGVEIVTNTQVVKPVVTDDKICVGLEYKHKDGQTGHVSGNAILACDGYKSTVGSYFDVPYDKMNCKMMKCLADNANIDIRKTPELQFYLIGNGCLSYAPDFPQCVAYGFPIGGKKMELGLMLRMTHAHGMKTVNVPDNKLFLKVWEQLKQDYPGFSSYFKDADILHEEITGLSNTGLVENFVPGKGVVLIGDSAGFIDPFGSSGLYSGMAMADFWTSLLSEKIMELTGKKDSNERLGDLWSDQHISIYKEAFEHSSIYKRIKSSYSLIGKFEWYIFKHLRTSARINRWWKIISLMLKLP